MSFSYFFFLFSFFAISFFGASFFAFYASKGLPRPTHKKIKNKTEQNKFTTSNNIVCILPGKLFPLLIELNTFRVHVGNELIRKF
jgi:hypothetical protein